MAMVAAECERPITTYEQVFISASKLGAVKRTRVHTACHGL